LTAPSPAPAALVVTEGLVKSFPIRGGWARRRRASVEALRGVDLAVTRGSIHAIVGVNGSGKSTLLRVLSTMVLPDDGMAKIDGHDVVRSAGSVRRLIGLSTGEERSLYWRLTARHNLEFAAALYGIDEPGQTIVTTLGLVGLEEDADRPVSGFSQGMARRLGLARALLHDPPLLLLDEPTRSLDPAATTHFHEVLRRIQRDHGVTTLLTTHDLTEAAESCDDVSALDAGRITGHVRPGDESDPVQAIRALLP